MDYSTSIDVHRIGQVLAFAPDAVLIFSTDGRLRSMPRICISGSMLPGDISVLSADGQLRAYLRSNDGDIPLEALDAQLLAEARIPVRPAWTSSMGVPSELSEHVAGQLQARMSALIESGVVLAAGPGRLGLAEDWAGGYEALRWEDLGVGVGGPEAGAGRIEGVLLDMGLLSERGERCLVLETAEGMVMVASPVTRLRVGGKFEVTRAHARQHWAIRSR